MTLQDYKTFFLKPRNVFIIFLIGINILNIQSILANRLNTYDIFRYSFPHLLNNQDLYLFYLHQYRDLYKYSPSFPVFFAIFSTLPYYISYFLWNNMCMIIMPLAIYTLPLETEKKSIICWFVFIECLTCLQGTQANTVLATLFILSFTAFERKQLFLAALCIAVGTYIKIFPIAGAALFLLYPGKVKFLGYLILCMALVFVLPLCFISFDQLIWQYNNWKRIVLQDHDTRYGISLVGLASTNFGINNTIKLLIQFSGLALFLSALLRYKMFSSLEFRLYLLASLLISIVLINHDAEDFSYTMAMSGVGIWYVLQPRQRWLINLMLVFILVVSVFPIDPTPKPLIRFMVKHALKALPVTILWLVLVYQILTKKFTDTHLNKV